MTCTCLGKNICKRKCVCHIQNMGCTEVCGCYAAELCGNMLTHMINIGSDQDDDEEEDS